MTKNPRPLPLHGDPIYDQTLPGVKFVFWRGTAKQPASIATKSMSPHEALEWFEKHWEEVVTAANEQAPDGNGDIHIGSFDS